MHNINNNDNINDQSDDDIDFKISIEDKVNGKVTIEVAQRLPVERDDNYNWQGDLFDYF